MCKSNEGRNREKLKVDFFDFFHHNLLSIVLNTGLCTQGSLMIWFGGKWATIFCARYWTQMSHMQCKHPSLSTISPAPKLTIFSLTICLLVMQYEMFANIFKNKFVPGSRGNSEISNLWPWKCETTSLIPGDTTYALYDSSNTIIWNSQCQCNIIEWVRA